MIDTKGTHLLLEYWGCDQIALSSPRRVEEAMLEAAKATGATVLKHFFQQFETEGEGPSGISGVVVIAESHLSIHTWPERGYAAVDAYTCGDCNPSRADRVLRRAFKADAPETMTIIRGAGPGRSIRLQH